MVTEAMELKLLAPPKKNYEQPRQHIKKQRHYFADKGLSSQSYGCSSSHVLFSTKKAECQRMDGLNCGVGEDS